MLRLDGGIGLGIRKAWPSQNRLQQVQRRIREAHKIVVREIKGCQNTERKTKDQKSDQRVTIAPQQQTTVLRHEQDVTVFV